MITLNVNLDELTQSLLSDSWTVKIRALSKSITLIENNDIDFAKSFLSHISDKIKSQKKSHVIGLTGLPGSGKSTIVNRLITEFRKQNKKVAVLAIDPSSPLTGGAVLGDRIRMQDHFKDDSVFIRSMSARGALGGLSHATQSVITLIKLLSFDKIIVETVGVGQSEGEIIKIADTVVLVLLPNTGDEVQFMKGGVIQLAHIFVINKTDLSDPYRMVHELEDQEAHKSGWQPSIVCTSMTENTGIPELIENIQKHEKIL